MTEAAQPMPDRLKVRMLSLNLKWFTTAADSEGVGLKAEQFTIRPSTCAQHGPVRKDWKRYCFLCQRQALHRISLFPEPAAAGPCISCI